jgi:benzoyl-CoA reductase subunit D
MVSRGIATAEILRGIHDSIAGRLVRLARATGAEGTVLVSGGLSRDEGLLHRLSEEASGGAASKGALIIRSHPDGMFAGALGAALLAARRLAQLEKLGRARDVARFNGAGHEGTRPTSPRAG